MINFTSLFLSSITCKAKQSAFRKMSGGTPKRRNISFWQFRETWEWRFTMYFRQADTLQWKTNIEKNAWQAVAEKGHQNQNRAVCRQAKLFRGGGSVTVSVAWSSLFVVLLPGSSVTRLPFHRNSNMTDWCLGFVTKTHVISAFFEWRAADCSVLHSNFGLSDEKKQRIWILTLSKNTTVVRPIIFCLCPSDASGEGTIIRYPQRTSIVCLDVLGCKSDPSRLASQLNSFPSAL